MSEESRVSKTFVEASDSVYLGIMMAPLGLLLVFLVYSTYALKMAFQVVVEHRRHSDLIERRALYDRWVQAHFERKKMPGYNVEEEAQLVGGVLLGANPEYRGPWEND